MKEGDRLGMSGRPGEPFPATSTPPPRLAVMGCRSAQCYRNRRQGKREGLLRVLEGHSGVNRVIVCLSLLLRPRKSHSWACRPSRIFCLSLTCPTSFSLHPNSFKASPLTVYPSSGVLIPVLALVHGLCRTPLFMGLLSRHCSTPSSGELLSCSQVTVTITPSGLSSHRPGPCFL